jgi:hypothetical protein
MLISVNEVNKLTASLCLRNLSTVWILKERGRFSPFTPPQMPRPSSTGFGTGKALSSALSGETTLFQSPSGREGNHRINHHLGIPDDHIPNQYRSWEIGIDDADSSFSARIFHLIRGQDIHPQVSDAAHLGFDFGAAHAWKIRHFILPPWGSPTGESKRIGRPMRALSARKEVGETKHPVKIGGSA